MRGHSDLTSIPCGAGCRGKPPLRLDYLPSTLNSLPSTIPLPRAPAFWSSAVGEG
jgi:hypothetical protein